MKDSKKKILGSKTSKKLALLLSAGTLVLPLTACKNQNIQQNIEEKPTMQLTDTSYISASGILEEYIENYELGDTSYIVEKLSEYTDLYEKLTTDEKSENQESVITYNFDGTSIPYDSFENGYYYIEDEYVKFVNDDMVRLKTVNGSIQIENSDGVCCIKNMDNVNLVKTIIRYDKDKSCTVEDEVQGKTTTKLEFDNNGRLISQINVDIDGNSKKYIYENGNINVYELYNMNDRLLEKGDIDGSYVIYHNGSLDKKIYDFNIGRAGIDSIEYHYNKNNELQYIDIYDTSEKNDGSYDEFKAKLLPNGDAYKYLKHFSKDGVELSNNKIEEKYQKYKKEVRVTRNEDGSEDTYSSIYDYTAVSPMQFAGEAVTGNIVYECRNGKVTISEKDGIITQYSESDGTFYNAYKVDNDKITYYSENGCVLKTIDKNKVETEYDEQGKIQTIDNGTTKTSYYNYEENKIMSVNNLKEESITVDIYGNKYNLNKGGYVSFYKNGTINMYKTDDNHSTWYLENGEEYVQIGDETTLYDVNHNIKSIARNGITTYYYDYDSNSISSIKVDGIERSYYENGNLKRIGNVENEEIQEVQGYELKKGSYISYYESGALKEYHNDKTNYYEYYESGNIKKIAENNTATLYDEDGKITQIYSDIDEENGGKCTSYYDYEANKIRSVQENGIITWYYESQELEGYQNNNEEIILIVNDQNGNEYNLNKGDYVKYRKNGNLMLINQEDKTYNFYKSEDSSYFIVKDKTNNIARVYHNDTILYETDEINSLGTVTSIDGKTKALLSDGTIIDDEIEEQEK